MLPWRHILVKRSYLARQIRWPKLVIYLPFSKSSMSGLCDLQAGDFSQTGKARNSAYPCYGVRTKRRTVSIH